MLKSQEKLNLRFKNLSFINKIFNFQFSIVNLIYTFAVAKNNRDVAQLASAPRSGRGGRTFESSHPDFFCFSNSLPTIAFFKKSKILCLKSSLLNETHYFCAEINKTEKMRLFYGFILCVYCLVLQAQRDMPRWVDNARKAIITIETFDKYGNVRKGNGFFVQNTGEAISDYTLFSGAESAIVTDADGRQMQVNSIIGADEMYDVIYFKVTVPRNVPFLPVAQGVPEIGAEVFLLPIKEVVQKGEIEEITLIKDLIDYIKASIPLTSSQISLPLLNVGGEVIAIAQADASGKNKTYGVSTRYIQKLRNSSIDIFSKAYASIGIRSGWSNNVDEAQLALLYYSTQQDASTYLETLNDFINHFPTLSDGYNSRASHYVRNRDVLAESQTAQMKLLDLAMEDMNKALKLEPKEDEGLYNQAKLIYEALLNDSTFQTNGWNIGVASEKLQRAIEINDLPYYRQLEGDMAFFQGDFEKAYNKYMIVNQSSYASSLSFFLAAKAKEMLPETNLSELIALMDSAVIRSMSVPSDAAAYLQESIDLKMQYGLYADAIKDYDQLYRVLVGNVSDAFYYYREQAKFRKGDLEGALIDIEMAIALDKQNALYYAEEASVYLRMQDPVKAQESVEKALALDDEFAASHRLLGVCLLRQEKKNEACKAFQQAKELGDPIVDKLIEENCR